MTEKKIDPGLLSFLEENYLDDKGNFKCPCCKARDELIKERGEIVKLLEEQVTKYKRSFPPAKSGKNAGAGSARTSGQKKGAKSSALLRLMRPA